MAYKVPKFLRRDGESLVFNDKNSTLYFYVPEIYFTREFAVTRGEEIDLLGIFTYNIVTGNKQGPMRRFNLPSVFTSKPTINYKAKDLKITKNNQDQEYRVLGFKYDDVVIKSVNIPQSVVYIEQFFKLLLSGKIPTSVPYNELYEYFSENAKLNGKNYGLSEQLFGIITSEMCRTPNNLSLPFRLSKSKDMYDYVGCSIKDIPKYVSPYAAISSENWDESIVNAMLNDKERNIPMERLLMESNDIEES